MVADDWLAEMVADDCPAETRVAYSTMWPVAWEINAHIGMQMIFFEIQLTDSDSIWGRAFFIRLKCASALLSVHANSRMAYPS